MSLKNQGELKRLHRAFEKEANSFRKLMLSVIYVARGWISEPSKAELLEKFAVPLWQYYGRVEAQEEYDRQMAIVRSSSALNPIQGAQIYSYAVFEGDDPSLLLRMAKRAGNLFSDDEITEFRTKQEAEIISDLPGLRPVEVAGLQVWSGLFGKPMIVMNSNPTAVWLNFLHYNGSNTNPLQGRNHDLELDPFAESLLAIEHLIEKATISKRTSRSLGSMNRKFQVALTFAGENRAYVSQVAAVLKEKLGEGRVFYDEDYQAELARPNLDTFLQGIYLEAELVVVFLCEQYAKKEWCGLEWRAIREIIKHKHDEKVMFMRFDDGDVPGTFSIDGYVDLRTLTPTAAAIHISNRVLPPRQDD